MIGRLQTERDKARILEGLRSASGDVDVAEWDARIGALGKRQFLAQITGKGSPSLFTSSSFSGCASSRSTSGE
jgi:hypothetical protein